VFEITAGSACHLLSLSYLARFIDPEDGGDMFLRKVGLFSTDYTALYPRRCENDRPYEYIQIIEYDAVLTTVPFLN
jgi:hypothetical protein